MQFIYNIFMESWRMLLESSVYILLGLLVGGLLKVFLSPSYVVNHLGKGRYRSVFKAALFGIPLPLCSCGVLPAAASLKRQGANNGATTAFLISTPESGVDSISISYALLDPIMTVARPAAAFLTAVTAGITENFFNPPPKDAHLQADLCSPVDGCCDGGNCDSPLLHTRHHSMLEKIKRGLHYAAHELWGDLALWFFAGLLLGGLIVVVVPDGLITSYLGGGLASMLIMLLVGIPVYICATASTPIAAALILKGVSPGAALVFLLVGPATNMVSLAMLNGLLGRKTTLRYLLVLALASVGCGLLLDWIYGLLGLSARAVIGEASEFIPFPLQLAGTLILLGISFRPLWRTLLSRLATPEKKQGEGGCGCEGNCGTNHLASFRKR